MPIREYRCDHCGVTFEWVQMTSEDIPSQCIHCKSERISQQFTAHATYDMGNYNSSSVTPKKDRKFS
jgi:putative FmdB family regulatory protein